MAPENSCGVWLGGLDSDRRHTALDARMTKLQGRSVCLVGNAPTTFDRSGIVDGCDVVIRINDASGFGGVNGHRLTHLFLINCGGQMREWLDDPEFAVRPVVAAAAEILLPIHPAKDEMIVPPLTPAERSHPDAANYADEARKMLEKHGKTVSVVSVEIFLQAAAIIGFERPERAMDAPSTGLIALCWALETFDDPIDIVGFGFAGWDGHRWGRERAFFEKLQAGGRIRLHPAG